MRYILKEIGDNESGSRPVTEQLPSISCNIATALHFFIFFLSGREIFKRIIKLGCHEKTFFTCNFIINEYYEYGCEEQSTYAAL
jgi:hypothetical protein